MVTTTITPRPDNSGATPAHIELPHMGNLNGAGKEDSPLTTPLDGAQRQGGVQVEVTQLNAGWEVPQGLGDVGQMFAEKDREIDHLQQTLVRLEAGIQGIRKLWYQLGQPHLPTHHSTPTHWCLLPSESGHQCGEHMQGKACSNPT